MKTQNGRGQKRFDITTYIAKKNEGKIELSALHKKAPIHMSLKKFDEDTGDPAPVVESLPLSEIELLKQNCANNIKIFTNAYNNCIELEKDVKQILKNAPDAPIEPENTRLSGIEEIAEEPEATEEEIAEEPEATEEEIAEEPEATEEEIAEEPEE